MTNFRDRENGAIFKDRCSTTNHEVKYCFCLCKNALKTLHLLLDVNQAGDKETCLAQNKLTLVQIVTS